MKANIYNCPQGVTDKQALVDGYNKAIDENAWRVVRVPMTPEMSEAGANGAREYYELFGGNSPSAIYDAMIAAAPTPLVRNTAT